MGKQWAREAKLSAAQAKPTIVDFVSALVLGFVMAFVLACGIVKTGTMTAYAGMQMGFWVWLGYIATVLYAAVIWEKQSLTLDCINVSYWLVNLLAIGALLAVWR